MKTINNIKNICVLLIIVALGLSSCEMKNELDGKYKLKANEGLLDLNLVPKAPSNVRTGESGEQMDVNTFGVEIIDVSTDAVVSSFESYAKLKEALPLVVPVGSYKIVAKSGVLQDASRDPYFEGSSLIDVKQGVQSKAEVVCKLGVVKVSLKLSDDFLTAFADDYSIGITNDQGGIMYFTKDNLSSVYLSIPNAAVSIKILAKVKDKGTGKEIQTTYTVTKPDNEQLTGGDSFNVNMKPTEDDNPDVPVEPSKPHFGLQLDIDLTMDETGVTIKVPTELIEESKPEEPGADGPEIIGAPRTVIVNSINPDPTVEVIMKASAGIKNLFVLIGSDNENFYTAIASMGLNERFDLANPGELKELLENDFENGGIGLIPPGTVIKDQTEFVFDISSFIPLLKLFEQGNHSFKLRLVDNNDKSTQEVVLSVVVE